MWGGGHQQPSLRASVCRRGDIVGSLVGEGSVEVDREREPAIWPPPQNTGGCQRLTSFHKELDAKNPGVLAIDLSFLPFCDMDHPGGSTVLPGWPVGPLPSHCNQVRMRGHSWLAPPSEYPLASERARRGKGPKIEGPPPTYTHEGNSAGLIPIKASHAALPQSLSTGRG